jgi:hypothetical protein
MRDKRSVNQAMVTQQTSGRTTATLVRTERASQVRVTGGICVNQASKPTTGIGEDKRRNRVNRSGGSDILHNEIGRQITTKTRQGSPQCIPLTQSLPLDD